MNENKIKTKKHGKKIIFAAALALAACAFIFCAFRTSAEKQPLLGGVSDERTKSFYTFLVCGADKAARNTDVIMLVSVDKTAKSINVLQIPRDTFVHGKRIDANTTRINGIYAAAYAASPLSGKERERAAMAAFAERLESALCIEIDRCVLLDTAAFVKIIDAVGGVEYEIERDMRYEDPAQGLSIDLKAGKKHLTGAEAEQLVRYRAGYAMGDMGRVEVREGFLSAVYAQVMENISPVNALKIAKELASSVTTDMSFYDIAFFIKTVYDIGADNLRVKTLSGSPVQNPETGFWIYYALNKRAALADINEYMNAAETEISYEDFDKGALFTDDPKGKNPYISEYYYSQE
ncbi:MAG: LCP family protein [Clostridia bacterium]|nr:LCP family protein [Clostridia bacterium]